MAHLHRPGQRRTARPAALPDAVPGPPRPGRTLLGYLLMPRPKDLFKALLMPLTFGLAAVAVGGVDTTTLLRAAIVLAALELLVYPARYQWNDVRGFAADQRHPAAADRGRLPGPLDRARPHVTASLVVAAGRLLVVTVLPVLLPGLHLGPLLLWVVAGVFGVAIAYEALRAAATGRTGVVPPPVRPAVVSLWIAVGAGYVVRGLTGLALVVHLPGRPALAVAAAVTLWAYGVAFVTSRWAVEATAFARLGDGRVTWAAEAGHAREHLLALVRWLPAHADPRHVTGPDDGSAAGWAALRGRTPVVAPWNLAAIVAGAAAAVTGRLLVGAAPAAELLTVAVLGAAGAVAAVVTGRGRVVAVVAGAAALLVVLMLRAAPATAVLPWLVVLVAYLRCRGGCLLTMGTVGRRWHAALAARLAPLARAVIGAPTWDVLTGRGSARA